MQSTVKKDVQTKSVSGYETPRLQTYGKLESLTKGAGGSLADASLLKT